MFSAFFRTVILYALLICVIRLLGKRQLGQMEASEFVVTMLVANLASIPMENPEMPIWGGILPILTVLGLELLLSLVSLRSIPLRRLLCGKPVILIDNGKLLQDNLRRTRVNMDELTCLLRSKDVLDIRQVQYAILETNGNLSVFPFPKEKPASAKDAGIQAKKQFLPLTLVSDGVLLKENLQLSGKNRAWVEQALAERGAAVRDTMLLTVDSQDKVIFYRKDYPFRK